MPKVIKFETENDAVVAFLKGEVTEKNLSAEQNRKVDRIMTCDDLIRRHGSMRQVIPILVKLMKHRYPSHGYTNSTARLDYVDTQAIIGSTIKHNRDYNVSLLIEEMAQTRRLAMTKKDAKTLAQCDRNKIMLIEKFMGDADIPDYESLQPVLPEIGFFPELMKADVPRFEDGSLDFDALEKELTILRKVDRNEDDLYTEIEVLK